MRFNKADVTDWLVMSVVTDVVIAATIFLFKHPDPINFATWGTVVGTICSVYHWLTIRDDKTPDCEGK
jgi:O-antigen/teichoic acid export membrane protein